MSSKKSKLTKEELQQLCIAHDQLVGLRESQTKETGSSLILNEILDQKISELESEITQKVKNWLMNTTPKGVM